MFGYNCVCNSPEKLANFARLLSVRIRLLPGEEPHHIMARKLSAIRQLSLQSEPPRHSSLKTPNSEDTRKQNASIRISVSAKPLNRPPNNKIKVAWDNVPSDKEKDSGSKLSIVLHNCDHQTDQVDTSEVEDLSESEPSIMLPLMQQPESIESANLKRIFQKHLRKTSNSPRSSEMLGNHSNGVIVVPLIDRPCANVDKRPSTAAQRRANFQTRTNSAFQTVCPPRPPLIRASSLPSKPAERKGKFPRKKSKSSKRCRIKDECEPEVSRKNADVITMVSLVSASESDAEESESIKEVQVSPVKQSPSKIHSWCKSCAKDDGKSCFSLRKTVKQVSFQPSSIHCVRSFSASFPARRASIATSILLDNAAKKLEKTLEKRSQQLVDQDEQIDAKRRLLRVPTMPAADNLISKQSVLPVAECVNSKNNHTESEDNQGTIETSKEKKCWETYCRMTQNGLTVSLDTILRGMLTPTEYRLRRKLSIERDATAESSQIRN